MYSGLACGRTTDEGAAADVGALLAREDPLDRRATEQMLVGVSTRKYARSLEPLPDDIDDF